MIAQTEIKLFCDRTNKALALVPINEDIEDAWPYKKLERGGAQVIITRFVKQHDINWPLETHRFEAKRTTINTEADVFS